MVRRLSDSEINEISSRIVKNIIKENKLNMKYPIGIGFGFHKSKGKRRKNPFAPIEITDGETLSEGWGRNIRNGLGAAAIGLASCVGPNNDAKADKDNYIFGQMQQKALEYYDTHGYYPFEGTPDDEAYNFIDLANDYGINVDSLYQTLPKGRRF